MQNPPKQNVSTAKDNFTNFAGRSMIKAVFLCTYWLYYLICLHSVFSRLHKLGLCNTQHTALYTLDKLGENFDKSKGVEIMPIPTDNK